MFAYSKLTKLNDLLGGVPKMNELLSGVPKMSPKILVGFEENNLSMFDENYSV